ncbi:MAG: hypothetical protein QOG63_1675 [Thermoleophilaceae bacterium]|jgi:hypothetical protein|nr:hypothetical protein [Thermoleophilaceae bacterium]
MTALRRTSRSIIVALCAALLMALAGSQAAQAKTNCGSFTKNGAHVTVYRITGGVGCRRARRVSHRVIGAVCNGEKLKGGWTCTHGAPALGEPANSGFTLTKGHNNVQGRVR